MMQLIRSRRFQLWALCVFGTVALAACRTQDKSEIEVEVRSVGFDNASNAPVVVLQDHDRKVALPIWIGPAEAQAIAMQMQGISPPRPMTHDLIKEILDGTGVEFRKVLIKDLKDSTYYARIFLHAGRQDLQVDSRPSDAIALAVRFHRPIFVASALLKGDAAIDLQHQLPTASMIKLSGVTVQNLTDELAEYFSVPPGRGVVVADVASDAPRGLQRGDVILEIDGTAVTGVGDLATRMQALKGAPAHLSVQRGSKRIPVQFAGSLSDTP
jgi:bifunctional DNase/RNase